jgi:uncharacterized protein YjiS (DUF1127 family)
MNPVSGGVCGRSTYVDPIDRTRGTHAARHALREFMDIRDYPSRGSGETVAARRNNALATIWHNYRHLDHMRKVVGHNMITSMMHSTGNPPYSIPSYSSVRRRVAEWSLTVLGCCALECVGRRRERSFLRVLEGEPFAAVVLGPRHELVGQGELMPVGAVHPAQATQPRDRRCR